MAKTVNKIPLRERKYAQTKLAILDAVVEALERKPFEDIGVRELCQTVEISEPTFFNYFPRKSDVLIYFIQMWTIEVSWHARKAAGKGGGIGAIRAVFDFTAKQVVEHPRVMSEIIAFQARMTEPPEVGEITLAERLVAFPDLEGVDTLPAMGLESIFPEQINKAIALSELPADTDVQTVMISLAAIFFGVPMFMCARTPETIGAIYRAQLHLLWEGVRAGGTRSRESKPT